MTAPCPLDASQHDTASCPGTEAAREKWLAAASASSTLYRACDARTVTETARLLDLAAIRLRRADLLDLARRADSLVDSFAAPLQAVRELQDRVAEEAGKLGAAYLIGSR